MADIKSKTIIIVDDEAHNKRCYDEKMMDAIGGQYHVTTLYHVKQPAFPLTADAERWGRRGLTICGSHRVSWMAGQRLSTPARARHLDVVIHRRLNIDHVHQDDTIWAICNL